MTVRGAINRILLLPTSALGDCVLSTPALRGLRHRYPKAEITVVADPLSADVFRHSHDVDRIVALDPNVMSRAAYVIQLLKLRTRRFDLLVDAHGAGRSFVQTLLIGGKRRIGFDIRASHRWAYTDCAPYLRDVHTVLRQVEILKPLGIQLDGSDLTPQIEITEQEVRRAQTTLENAGIPATRPYIVIHPGAGVHKRVLKQWLPDRYAALIDQIRERLDVEIVLTGHGEDESQLIRVILAAARHQAIDLSGQTNVRSLAAILKGSALYIGSDTGPMHIAAAVGTAVVAIFGPSDPNHWRPWSDAPVRIVRESLPCSPCPGLVCDHDHQCMTSIDVDRVFHAVCEVRAQIHPANPGANSI